MWNRVLTDLWNDSDAVRCSRFLKHPTQWYESFRAYQARTRRTKKLKLSDDAENDDKAEEDGEDDDDDEYRGKMSYFADRERAPVGPYQPLHLRQETEAVKHIRRELTNRMHWSSEEKKKLAAKKEWSAVNICGRRVQVIVKLANIHLTPEKPKYAGGSWHVEGMMNESIVASGIYYYDSENISESRLHFREAVSEPEYEQNDNDGVQHEYGLVNEGPLNQDLGYILTQTNRCIAFPNTCQHRVEEFELVDKTKPGHRKILVFFLVDPTKRVTSTRLVPPQQTLITKAEAVRHRSLLMAERKVFVEKNTAAVFEREFSLCEH